MYRLGGCTLFEWLKTFIAVYRTLNFTTAASQLSMSQPSISHHIRKLEEYLNVTLFVRNGRQEIVPTKEADYLYPKVIDNLDSLNKSFAQVLNINERRKECVIATSYTVSDYIFPSVLSELLTAFPLVNFSFNEMNSNAVMDALEKKQADIGLLEKPVSKSTIKKEIIFKDKLVLVGATDAQYWVLREKESGTRFFNELYLKENDLNPNIIETNSQAITKKLVVNGIGKTIISNLALTQYPEEIETQNYEVKRNIYIARNTNFPDAFIDQIYQLLKDQLIQTATEE